MIFKLTNNYIWIVRTAIDIMILNVNMIIWKLVDLVSKNEMLSIVNRDDVETNGLISYCIFMKKCFFF
jgi:hypothetical protein